MCAADRASGSLRFPPPGCTAQTSAPNRAPGVCQTHRNVFGAVAGRCEERKGLLRDRVDRHMPRRPVLALRDGDDPRAEINVLPAQAPLLVPAHPGVQGQV